MADIICNLLNGFGFKPGFCQTEKRGAFNSSGQILTGCNVTVGFTSTDAPENVKCDSNWGGGGGGGGGGGVPCCNPGPDTSQRVAEDTFTPQDTVPLPPQPPIGCELRWVKQIQPYAKPLVGDPKTNYPLEAYSEPIIADLNGDGQQEVIIRSSPLLSGLEKVPPQLFVFDYKGDLVWSKEILTPEGEESSPVGVKSSCAVGDIDGDKTFKEIVCSSGTAEKQFIFAFDHDGTKAPGWPVYIDELNFPSLKGNSKLMLAIGNTIKKTGKKEIIAKTPDNLYLFNHEGTLLAGWPKPVSNTQSLALGDIDKDGKLEIVAFSSDSALSCWKGNGEETAGFPFKVESTQNDSISLADINADGNPEIILRHLKIGEKSARVDIIGSGGKQMASFEVPGELPTKIPGEKDLLVNSSIGNLGSTGLSLLHKNFYEQEFSLPSGPILIKKIKLHSYAYVGGEIQQSFEAEIEPFDPLEEKEGVVLSDYQAIADIDGDNAKEILLTCQECSRVMLRVFDPQGKLENILKRESGNRAYWNSPALGDLDGDGWIDVVIGGYEEGMGGRIYTYECGGSFNPSSIEWPMHRHDAQGTINHAFPITGGE